MRVTKSDGGTGRETVDLDGEVVNDKVFALDADTTVFTTSSFTNASHGKLVLAVAGPKEFGSLATNHAGLFLGGTLQIETDAAFWPASGQKFRVLWNSSRVGRFATVLGTTRGGETVSYSVAYTSDGAKLKTR